VGEIAASLGGLYLVSGNYDKAEREFREAIEILPKFFPPEHNIVVSTNALLGLTLSRAGRPTEGEPLLRAALATRRKILPAGSPLIPLTESALGECLLGQTRYAEAKPLLVSGYDGLKAKLGENDARVVEAKQQLEKLPRPEN
jgi:tetratricopeptide (TPR) repeat protein